MARLPISSVVWLPGAAAAALLAWGALASQIQPGPSVGAGAPCPGMVQHADALLIDLDDHLSPTQRARILDGLPGTLALNSEHSDEAALYRLTGTTEDLQRAYARLVGVRGVQAVEPDVMVQLVPAIDFDADVARRAPAPLPPLPDPPISGEPDDPLWAFQWHMEQIGLPEAWSMSRGQNVVVAIIDTGVAYADSADGRFRRVADLEAPRMVPGYDFVDDNDRPFDEHGHGTHVAGTVAQTTNNGYGGAGVAPRARIMPIRVLDAQGRGRTGDIADAIRWAADNGAHIINMSLGGPLPSRVMADAIAYANQKGVTVVAAAGNSATHRPSFPAAYPHVISVSATQFDRTVTFYSNYGSSVDVAAPGGNVRVDQNQDGRPDGVLQETLARGNTAEHEFAAYMGTSMAAPHVAGLAALLHANGVRHPDRIERILKDTADRSFTVYDRGRHGAGIVDAPAALRATANQHGVPAGLLAGLLALGLLGTGRRTGGPALSMATTLLAAIFGASGFALVVAPLAAVGVADATMLQTAVSPVMWPAMMSHHPAAATALWMSALVPLGIYAFAGGATSKRARGLVVGLMVGVSAGFLVESVAPLRDLTGVPGMGLLDRAWLVVNGTLGLGLASLAARPRREDLAR